MGKPTYFSNFPDVDYAIESDHAGNLTKLEIKDYFHLLRVREDIYAKDSLYTNYYISNGERPDQISYKVYGDERYYWIILQVNDITEYYNQWPLSQPEFEKYLIHKYGSHEASQQVHHYETVEVLDEEGHLILPKGIVVGEEFSYEYKINRKSFDTRVSYPREVTTWEYEYELNEKKSEINILRKEYISDVMRDIRNYARNLRKLRSDLDIGTVMRRD